MTRRRCSRIAVIRLLTRARNAQERPNARITSTPSASLKWLYSGQEPQKNILAVALVGSYARKTARPASDIDLVMLTYEPTSFRTDTTWCHAIDWAAVNARPLKCKDEDYGLLWSRRLLLDYNGGEIEFGFVSPAWADVHPVDTGTRRVIADRCRVVHDPRGLLKRVCATVDRRVERRAGGCLGSSTAYDTRFGRDPANAKDRPRSRRRLRRLRPPISGA